MERILQSIYVLSAKVREAPVADLKSLAAVLVECIS